MIAAVVNGELKLIKNVDIFCVLSNLLDNAIEAQTFVDNKRVEVFIDENEDVCSLKIYNSISDDMVKAFKGMFSMNVIPTVFGTTFIIEQITYMYHSFHLTYFILLLIHMQNIFHHPTVFIFII